MSLPNRSTKLKVAFGYILLTALLFISIGYIYQEMKSLSGTGDDEAILSQRRHVTNQIISQLYQAEVIGQSLSTGQIEQYYRYQRAMKQATTALDSLRTLLTDSIQLARLDTVGMLFMDKERNMRNLLKAIQDGGTDILYKQHIDELIAQQDSLLSLPHVRKKVITHTNSYIIRKKPKSFFKRLGEVFSPGKADSTQVNNVIQEEYTDTLTEAYSPADTVVTMLKNIQSRVTDTQQERMEMVNHLILIDDDRIQLQLTTAMLERPGVTVTCCHHPEELLNQLKEKRFDVLLTDIQMPAMNGFDLLKAIRTLDTSWVQTLPVIALTARSDMDENYFCSHGFAGCLHKPFTINELFTAIFQVTGKDVPATGNPTPHIAPAKENHPQQETLDFSALTAFSEDDPEAASEILRTFISETKKNRECMEEALAKKNMEDITAIAHKLLPLFTMLGATRCIPALTWMEQRRGTTEIGEEAIEKTNFIIEEIEKVIDEAKKQIEIPNEA